MTQKSEMKKAISHIDTAKKVSRLITQAAYHSALASKALANNDHRAARLQDLEARGFRRQAFELKPK